LTKRIENTKITTTVSQNRFGGRKNHPKTSFEELENEEYILVSVLTKE